MLWTICGAGRGVGKTRLGLALAKLLPDATYAKLGCAPAKPGKPKNYFREEADLEAFFQAARHRYQHIIAEANSWALEGKGDMIIFIDGVPSRTSTRADVDLLRSNAHIRVDSSSSADEWSLILRDKLGDEKLSAGVCGLLADQKQFASTPRLSVRTKVWFVAGGERVFGTGLADLLDNIDLLGSLTESARTLKISYRHAWDLIKTAEKHLGAQLIIPRAGGAGGGKSVLSAEGRWLLDVFKRVNEEVAAYADNRFAAHYFSEDQNG
ncbi:MAG: LysR family transcriptional regulator [Armatimonadetes bacterium]|nr:LysR family transcriptional regulator [Armatimonadota bacterium]